MFGHLYCGYMCIVCLGMALSTRIMRRRLSPEVWTLYGEFDKGWPVLPGFAFTFLLLAFGCSMAARLCDGEVRRTVVAVAAMSCCAGPAFAALEGWQRFKRLREKTTVQRRYLVPLCFGTVAVWLGLMADTYHSLYIWYAK
jgi:hypothetical protein